MSELIAPALQWISLVADIFAIVGITGIIGWGVTEHSADKTPEARVYSIIALLFRLSACLLSLVVLGLLAFFLSLLILFPIDILFLIILQGGSGAAGDVMHISQPVSLVLALLIMGPVYVLLCASIFKGSWAPFREVWRRLFRNQAT